MPINGLSYTAPEATALASLDPSTRAGQTSGPTSAPSETPPAAASASAVRQADPVDSVNLSSEAQTVLETQSDALAAERTQAQTQTSIANGETAGPPPASAAPAEPPAPSSAAGRADAEAARVEAREAADAQRATQQEVSASGVNASSVVAAYARAAALA